MKTAGNGCPPRLALVPTLSVGERRIMQPEKRLMLAVLEDAARMYWETEGSPDSVPRSEVDEWFGSDAREWPFSFLNVCRVLGLDPAEVRGRVACLRQLRAA